MTGEQAAWLTAHRAEGYRPLGTLPGGGARWVKRGMLHPDGKFELMTGQRPAIHVGSFEVAVLEHSQAPEMRGP